MPKQSAVQVSYTLSSDEESDLSSEFPIKQEQLSDEENATYTSGSAADTAAETAEKIKSDPDSDDSANINRGLANVMNQILNKKTKTTAILAKAKTDRQILLAKKRKVEDGEDEDNKDKIKKEIDNETPMEKQKRRKLWENMSRIKPDVLEREKERALQRIATRGVVQLFNAVRQQQKTVEEKLKQVGSSVRKQDHVLDTLTTGQFVDVLKKNVGKDAQKNTSDRLKMKEEGDSGSDEEATGPSWKILRDDFMMGAKMKDWDKHSDSEDAAADIDDDNVNDENDSDFSDT